MPDVEKPKSRRIKQTRDADGSVFKKTEVINGKKTVVWYVRKRYRDFEGIWREKKRRTNSFGEVSELKKEIAAEVASERKPRELAARWTFRELADWYKDKYLIAPRYVGDRKISGLDSYQRERYFVDRLINFFGDFRHSEITHAMIERYRENRLAEAAERIREARRRIEERNARIKRKKLAKPKKLSERFEAQTNLTAVDRELQRMRAILNKAIQKGWLTRNPFKEGDPLITISQESMRERILTRPEESALLAQCTGAREHLYAAIIFALDTAMRQTEQARVTWSNVDWGNRVIRLKSSHTKAKRGRVVPITKRLHPLLVALYEQSGKKPGGFIFPYSRFKRSFKNACRDAEIDNLLWRDLRATGITWMLDAGVEESKVMKIVGHSNYKTFLRYVRLSDELAQEAADKMDARRAELEKSGKFSPLEPAPKN